jgi:hypothetical protein
MVDSISQIQEEDAYEEYHRKLIITVSEFFEK